MSTPAPDATTQDATPRVAAVGQVPAPDPVARESPSAPPPQDSRAGHRRRALRLWPGLTLTWTIVTLGASRLASVSDGNVKLFELATALLIGALTAYFMAMVETRPLARRTRRSGRGGDLVLRTLLYTAVAFVSVAFSYIVLELVFPSLFEGARRPPLAEILTYYRFWIFIGLLLVASLAINFFLHLRLVVGGDHLHAIFTGRYREPVLEDRVFVFIDLVDSTAIAQELGPLEFTHFKHDFFSDLSDAVLGTDGLIVQYVGDEVMLTWSVADARATGGPLDFVRLAHERLGARESYYLDTYGVLPRFRTGVHTGQVVVAEVGDIRRDIVYSGDVVNTAARLLQACRPNGHAILISREAHDLMPEAFRQNFQAREALELRGRIDRLDVFADRPAPSVVTDGSESA